MQELKAEEVVENLSYGRQQHNVLEYISNLFMAAFY